MHSSFPDEFQQLAERIVCGADNYTWEVGGTLVECFRYCKIKGLVCSKSHECLHVGEYRARERHSRILTMTSTVSYRLTTIPSSSIIGTADIERSENIWTTSNTGVVKVAVAMGQYGLVFWLASSSSEGGGACT